MGRESISVYQPLRVRRLVMGFIIFNVNPYGLVVGNDDGVVFNRKACTTEIPKIAHACCAPGSQNIAVGSNDEVFKNKCLNSSIWQK